MCLCCEHPQRTAIDLCIVSGQSERHIERQFSLTKGAVGRHKKCLRAASPQKPAAVPAYKTSGEAALVERVSVSIVSRVSSLVDVLERQAAECLNDRDRKNMNGTAVALLKALELNARLNGELQNQSVNIAVNVPSVRDDPAFGQILGILRSCPECFAKVEAVLKVDL